MRLGLLSLGFPNFRYDIAQKYLDQSIEHITSSYPEVELIPIDTIITDLNCLDSNVAMLRNKHIDALIIQVGTYSYGVAMIRIIKSLKVPYFLWSFEEPEVSLPSAVPLNSLCGMNMYMSFLYHLNLPYSWGHGSIQEIHESLHTFIMAGFLKSKIYQSRFCIIGGKAPGFYLSDTDELKFTYKFGTEIEYLSIDDLVHQAKSVSIDRIESEMKEFTKNKEIQVSKDTLQKTVAMILALKDYAENNNIQAFAIRCWPEFQSLYDMAVCGVVSYLNDIGYPTACEGDITGLMTMYIQYALNQQTVFFADLVHIDKNNELHCWHCGNMPASLSCPQCSVKCTEHVTIKNNIEMSVSGVLKEGEVTLSKLSLNNPDNPVFLLCAGTSVLPKTVWSGSQCNIKINAKKSELLDVIASNGIEHHYCISYGNTIPVLKEFCKWMEIHPAVL